jgi:hypothetical protein
MFMTESEAADFVVKLASVWAGGISGAFIDVWHPDGVPAHPMLDKQLRGIDIPNLHRAQLASAPDLKFEVVGWTWREDIVAVEWSVRRTLNGREFSWQGVDIITLREGNILKEVVYSDTAPPRALSQGKAVEPMMKADEMRTSSNEASR